MIRVGWEIETLNMTDVPLTASMRIIAIVKRGKHQKTVELFYDHLMSEYCQQRMGKDHEGLIPTKPGATMKYNAPFWRALRLSDTSLTKREYATHSP